jgi:predicted ATP-dependent serine protease
MYTSEIDSDAGGVSQVRACTVKLMEIARKLDMAILIASHVNKAGDLAGPKALEHLVDCVINLEGDRLNRYRMLRVIKNRYGSTDNSEVLEMTSKGFKKVLNPSNISNSMALLVSMYVEKIFRKYPDGYFLNFLLAAYLLNFVFLARIKVFP